MKKNMLFLKEQGIFLKSTGAYGMPYEYDGENIKIGISEWGFAHIYKKPISMNSERVAFDLYEIELTKEHLMFS